MESQRTVVLWLLLLSWSDNSLSLDDQCPGVCFCDNKYEYVSCVGEQDLTTVPSNWPKTILRLELKNFAVVNLTSKTLEGLETLEELKLQQMTILNIEKRTFSGLVNLVRLDLSQNSISNLTNETFDGLLSLRYLDLSANQMKYVEDVFTPFVTLEQLSLRSNQLLRLTERSFSGLLKVQYLNLDGNKIATIEIGTFQYLTNLAHLILSNNPLNTLHRLDFFSSRLQYIDISHVGLKRVPQSLTKFVRDLRLAKNNITKISIGDFESYSYLGLLVLDDNMITEIESDALGRQEFLMRLWLNGNRLTKVPLNLPPSLRALYMEENLITNITSYNFHGLVNLEQLFLQRNKIQELPTCAFWDLIRLRNLDLQANLISTLEEGAFSNLSALETLDLSQNDITRANTNCFSGLDKLSVLQLSRISKEVELDDTIFDPLSNLKVLELYDSPELAKKIINTTRILNSIKNVEELNIMHNKITKLREDFPSFFPNLKTIKLGGNEWHCDPDILWLTRWMTTSVQIKFYQGSNIACATPPHLKQIPIFLLKESSFVTTTAMLQASITSTAFVFTPSANETIQPKTNQPEIPTTNETFLKPTPKYEINNDIFVDDEGTPISESTEFNYNITNLALDDNSKVNETYVNISESIAKELLQENQNALTATTSENKLNKNTVIIIACIGSVCLIVLLIIVMVKVVRCYKSRGNPYTKRRNSISYYSQTDEVSIVTISEGTIGLETDTHHGVGNKLYYVIENSNCFLDPTIISNSSSFTKGDEDQLNQKVAAYYTEGVLP